jgi:hypothetical protein
MWNRIRNIWRPENFHYSHKLGRVADCFEGWYFKIVDPEGRYPLAVIPGVFLGGDAHAFVQVLDGRRGQSWYHRYPIADFEASPVCFDVRIAGNRFRSDGFSLHIDPKGESGGPAIRGRLELGPWSRWPVTAVSPGVMGPYSFAPRMQCYHGILSLDHELRGALVADDRTLSFDGGRGYLEKDWGQGFPLGYVWTQSNHFDRDGICVTASVATVPWVTGATPAWKLRETWSMSSTPEQRRRSDGGTAFGCRFSMPFEPIFGKTVRAINRTGREGCDEALNSDLRRGLPELRDHARARRRDSFAHQGCFGPGRLLPRE